MTSRPLAASRRNPLAVMEPSGYARAAAILRRSGVWGQSLDALTLQKQLDAIGKNQDRTPDTPEVAE
jgi:hypothetical protein